MFKVMALIIFIIVALINIYGEGIRSVRVRLYTKPLLMPLLLLYYLVSARDINVLIILALCFGFLGDVFLMKEEESFLLLGLGSFLLGHIFYISYYLISIDFNFPEYFYIWLIPYIVILILLGKVLLPYMKNFKLPGLIYMIVIILMSYSSLLRHEAFETMNFLLPFIGSLFFILSDSVLACDLFKTKLKLGGIIVMTTYILAQSLVIIGIVI